MASYDERLKRAEKNVADARDEVARIRALRRAARRKEDTRRRIVLGGLVLKSAAEDEQFGAWLRGFIDGGLTRPADRRLFGLEPPPDGLAPDSLLSFLNSAKIRCTYGAAAAAAGLSVESLCARLGGRRPETSWIVNAGTGVPTGFAPEQTHPDLRRSPEIITDPDALRARRREWLARPPP